MEQNIDIENLFEKGSEKVLESYLNLLHPADIAELFDLVERGHWPVIASHLSAERLGEVMAELDDGQIEALGSSIRLERLVEVVHELETDDAADVLQELPDAQAEAVLEALDHEDRDELETLLAHPEDSAGGLMQAEVCSLAEGLQVKDAIEAIRLARQEMDEILDIYVVDNDNCLIGTVHLEDLILSLQDDAIATIRKEIQHQVNPDVDQEEVAAIFKKYDLAALPVVDGAGALLGRITFDDIQDVLEEEATEDVMVMAGASSEELVYGTDFLRIALFRLPWLVSSLVGSLVTTILVPMFSDVPGDTIILASFVPVVMAMTGNVGSQTAMIITRGLAIGRVEVGTTGGTLAREISVGFIMGLAAGVLVGIFALIKNGNPILGVTLSVSMLASMSVAAMIGALAPLVFKRMGIDPAIAAGPLVTTLCDVLGVAVYLLVAFLILG